MILLKNLKMNKIKLLIVIVVLTLITLLSLTAKNIKQNLDSKSDQIEFLKKNLENKKKQIKNIHSKLNKKNIIVENLIFEDGIKFKKKVDKNFKIKKKNFILKEFYSNDIIFAKHPDASSSAYLDYYDNKIYLVTATGQISYSNFSNFSDDEFTFNNIKSNIRELIKYEEFYNSSQFGIKDILIYNDQIYVSYIKEHYKNCFSTSILFGNLNNNFINFVEFYSPSSCVSKNDVFFDTSKHDKMVVHQSGGRIIIVNNKLIFSTGEYRLRTHAQDSKNDFGKIISIDLDNKEKKIISMGHRNPQGLYFSEDLNSFFSTEHGPNGGDEINLINNELEEKKIQNFGWPISSYGRHYHDDNNDNDPRYKLSPLNKSHSQYGFIEPLKYFDPSVGISQIIGLDDKFINSSKHNFLVGTMGSAKKLKDGMISLFYFEYDESNKKITSSEFIPIKSRVRDLIYINDHNISLMYLENNNSIGLLKKN